MCFILIICSYVAFCTLINRLLNLLLSIYLFNLFFIIALFVLRSRTTLWFDTKWRFAIIYLISTIFRWRYRSVSLTTLLRFQMTYLLLSKLRLFVNFLLCITNLLLFIINFVSFNYDLQSWTTVWLLSIRVLRFKILYLVS